jgi:plasmid stabilization system protein ParE
VFEDKYIFRETLELKNDIQTAVDSWEDRYGERVAHRFEGAIDAVEDHIGLMPYAGRELEFLPGVREMVVSKKYQYAFYYRINETADGKPATIEIIAFAFQSKVQDPEKLKTLLSRRLDKELDE